MWLPKQDLNNDYISWHANTDKRNPIDPTYSKLMTAENLFQ